MILSKKTISATAVSARFVVRGCKRMACRFSTFCPKTEIEDAFDEHDDELDPHPMTMSEGLLNTLNRHKFPDLMDCLQKFAAPTRHGIMK